MVQHTSWTTSNGSLHVHTCRSARTSRFPIVICIHGGFHTKGCWEPFQACLAELHISSLAFDLRGHGESQDSRHLNSYRLRDYLEDVITVVQEGVDEQQPFILLGHSMGAALCQYYLAELGIRTDMRSPAGAILLAGAPPHLGKKHFRSSLIMLRHPFDLIRSIVTRDLRWMFRSTERVREYFFCARTPEGVVQQLHSHLQSESLHVVFHDLFNFPVPGAGKTEQTHPPVPFCLIGAEDDPFVPPALSVATQVYYQAPCCLVPGGHDLMLDIAYEQVAVHLLLWMQSLMPTESPEASVVESQ